MNGKSKLTHQSEHDSEAQSRLIEEQLQQQQPAGKTFDSVEAALRYDASQNPVPGKVAERLQRSVEREGLQPTRSWWKRLFGG